MYAVEASNMAETARRLAEENGYKDKLIVIKGKVEEIEVPEPVVCLALDTQLVVPDGKGTNCCLTIHMMH